MGEVVQALKLVYNDMEETCEDSFSKNDGGSFGPDSGFRGPDSSWWNGSTPRLTYAYTSPFVTIDCCSGPLEEINRPVSALTLVGGVGFLTQQNRSGPLETIRSRLAFYRSKGSMSEHGLLSRVSSNGYDWV